MGYSILLHTIGINQTNEISHWTNATKYIKENSISRLSYAMQFQWCWNFQLYPEIEQHRKGDGKCVYIKFNETPVSDS